MELGPPDQPPRTEFEPMKVVYPLKGSTDLSCEPVIARRRPVEVSKSRYLIPTLIVTLEITLPAPTSIV